MDAGLFQSHFTVSDEGQYSLKSRDQTSQKRGGKNSSVIIGPIRHWGGNREYLCWARACRLPPEIVKHVKK